MIQGEPLAIEGQLHRTHAVVVVHRGGPGVQAGIDEVAGHGEGAALVEGHGVGEADDRRDVADADGEGVHADAAVVIGHRHGDRVLAVIAVDMAQAKGLLIEGQLHGARAVAVIHRGGPGVRAGIGEHARDLKGLALGEDHVLAGVHRRGDVGHGGDEGVRADAAVIIGHRHGDRVLAVVAVGVRQGVGLVLRQGQGHGACAVAVIHRGGPGVRAGIGERACGGEGGTLIAGQGLGALDGGGHALHGHGDLRHVEAAVIVGHGHGDRVQPVIEVGVGQGEGLVVGQAQGLRASAVAVIHRGHPVVGAGIAERARGGVEITLGDDRPRWGLDDRGHVAHGDEGRVEAHAAVVIGHRHGDRVLTIVEVGVGQSEAVVVAEGQGRLRAAVAVIHRGLPGVGAGIGEHALGLVQAALVDDLIGPSHHGGLGVDHGHGEGVHADAAVIVGDGDGDGVLAVIGVVVDELEALGIQIQLHLALLAAVVHGGGPGVGAGISEGAVEDQRGPLGHLHVIARVHHGHGVGHGDGHGGHPLTAGAVGHHHPDQVLAVVGVHRGQAEGLVSAQGQRPSAQAVVVIHRGGPDVGVRIDELALEIEGGALHHLGGVRDLHHGLSVGHLEAGGVYADAAVIVGHRHRHRVGPGGGVGVIQGEALISAQGQRLRASAVTVVHRSGPGVRAGIHEGADAHDAQAVGLHHVGAGGDGGGHVEHGDGGVAAARQQGVAHRQGHVDLGVIPEGDLHRLGVVIHGAVGAEIPGVDQRVPVGIARRAGVEAHRLALVEGVRAAVVGHRGQVAQDHHGGEVRGRLQGVAVHADGAAHGVEHAAISHLQGDVVAAGLGEDEAGPGLVRGEIHVVEEPAVAVEIPEVRAHAVAGIEVEGGAAVQGEGDARGDGVRAPGPSERRVGGLRHRDPPDVHVGLRRHVVVGHPQPDLDDRGGVALGVGVGISVGEDGPGIAGILGGQIVLAVAVEVPLVEGEAADRIGVEGAAGVEVEGLAVGPHDVIPGVGHRRLHEQRGGEHDDGPRGVQHALPPRAAIPRSPVGARGGHVVGEVLAHPAIRIAVPVQAVREQIHRGRLGQAEALHQGEHAVVVVALPQPAAGHLLLRRLPPGVPAPHAGEGELHHARGRGVGGVAGAAVAEARAVVAVVQPDLVLGLHPGRDVDVEVALRRLQADGAPLTRAVVGAAVPAVAPAASARSALLLTPGVHVHHVGHDLVEEAALHLGGARLGHPQRHAGAGDGVHHHAALVDRLALGDLDAVAVAVAVGVAGVLHVDVAAAQPRGELEEAPVDVLGVGVLGVIPVEGVAVDQERLEGGGRGRSPVASARPAPGGLLDPVQIPEALVDADVGPGVEIIRLHDEVVLILPHPALGVPHPQGGGVGRVLLRVRVGVGGLDDPGVAHGLDGGGRGAVAEVPLVGQGPSGPGDALQAGGAAVDDLVAGQGVVPSPRHADHVGAVDVLHHDEGGGGAGLAGAVHGGEGDGVLASGGVARHGPGALEIAIVVEDAVAVAVHGVVGVPPVVDHAVVVGGAAAVEVGGLAAGGGGVRPAGVGHRLRPGDHVHDDGVGVGLARGVEHGEGGLVLAVGPVDVAGLRADAGAAVAEGPLVTLHGHVIGGAAAVEGRGQAALGHDPLSSVGHRGVAEAEHDVEGVEVSLERVIHQPQGHGPRARPEHAHRRGGPGGVHLEGHAVVIEIPLVAVHALVVAAAAGVQGHLKAALSARRLREHLIRPRVGHGGLVRQQGEAGEAVRRLVALIAHRERDGVLAQAVHPPRRGGPADDVLHGPHREGAVERGRPTEQVGVVVLRALVEQRPGGLIGPADVVRGPSPGAQRDAHVVVDVGLVVAHAAPAGAVLIDLKRGVVEVQRVREIRVAEVGRAPAEAHHVPAAAHVDPHDQLGALHPGQGVLGEQVLSPPA